MPVHNISANQARTVYASSGGSDLRGRAAATNGNTINTGTSGLLIGYFYFTGGVYVNYRSFLNFDLSSISGTVTGVTLTLNRLTSQNFPQFFIVQSEAGDDLALTDYQDGIVGATGYPFDDDATKFIDSAHNPNDGGGAGDDITITLNSAAVTHANSVIGSGKFKMAIINVHDFNDTYEADDDGFSSGLAVQGVSFSSTDDSTSGNYPILNVTTADAVSPSGITLKGGTFTLKGGTLTIK